MKPPTAREELTDEEMASIKRAEDYYKPKAPFGVNREPKKKKFKVYYLDTFIGTVEAENVDRAKWKAEANFKVEIDGEMAYLDYEDFNRGEHEGHLDIFSDLEELVVNSASKSLRLREVI